MNFRVYLLAAFFAFFLVKIEASAQVSRISPEQPRWGQALTIIYDSSSKGAKFNAQDDVYLSARLTFPDHQENVAARMSKDGSLFKYELPVKNEMAVAGVHFITLNGGWDEQAYTSVLIYRSDGKPARGALESKIASGRYREFFEKEVALYPDNYSAYRSKWTLVVAVEIEKAAGMIRSDLKMLESVRAENAELLSVLCYANLLLSQEGKAVSLIQKLSLKHPDSFFTFRAIEDYENEVINRNINGTSAAEVARIKLSIVQNNPKSEMARSHSRTLADDQRASLDLIEMICREWIKVEPENPQPYFNLAQAYRTQYRKYDEGSPLIEKTIALLLENKLRMFGDVAGKQNQRLLGAAYLVSADLAFRQKQISKAVSAVRVAESFEQEPPFAAYLLEAKIWRAGSQEDKAERAFIEAWRRGSQEAEERLKARYRERTGNLNGFDEYLLSARKDEAAKDNPEMWKRPAPPFKASSLDGKTFDLNALQGKVVVLNLWFIACGPCRKEIPKLNEVVREFRDKNVIFIAPTFDNPESLKAFLKTSPFEYSIVPNAEELIVGTFNASSFPTHIVIDQEGRIDSMLIGGDERRPDQVRRALLRLLNVQTSRSK